MLFSKIQKTDEKILLSIQDLRIEPLTFILTIFTWTGMGKFWITVALALNFYSRFYQRLPDHLLNAFFAPLIVWAINYVLKKFIRRERPAVANKNITALTKVPCFSFPSSHAGSTFSFFFILWWWDFPGVEMVAAWATIVSFSRMYLGVHYLSDIVGGVMVGFISAAIIYILL